MTHWVEFVLLGPVSVLISPPFWQAGASEKPAQSAVTVLIFLIRGPPKTDPKSSFEKRFQTNVKKCT